MNGKNLAESGRLRSTIIATSLGFVLVQLDVSIVNVGLARIDESFNVGVTGLEWIVDGYALAFASLMLSAGALGDRIGARRAFMIGFCLFVIASFACGIAPDAASLIAARILQGAGAAGLVPPSLALLNHACQGDGKARAHAVGLWTAAGAVALAVGPVLGGLIIDWVGWRCIFLVNVPIGLFGLWMTMRYVSETELGEGALDLPGQILSVISLSMITAGVIEGGASGWTKPFVIFLLAVGIAAAGAFLFVERWTKRPMLPLEFFRQPSFSMATLVGFVVNFTLYGAIFSFNLFLQRLAGYSPSLSGLAFLPFPVALLVANLCAGFIISRFGPRLPMAFGLAVAVVGFALLSLVTVQTRWFAMVPGLVLLPIGIGSAVPAMTTALLSSVPKSRSGVASGVLNTIRQAGGAIGVAIFGGLFASNGAAGMHTSFVLAIVLLGIASAMVFSVRSFEPHRSVAPEGVKVSSK